VVRDEIRIPSVPAAFMIAAGTGYIQLRDFSEATDRELGAALRDLTKQGMQRLLLDIRENPGGPLEQAIKVSNRFLKKGALIVYTRGRIPNSDQDYHAVENSDYTDLPVVALANRRSASASEIVTGALQDHDRGLVVGETTWGKALVQSIYRLSEGAGLALTTAHYFTPAGRLIQRPWDESFDEYLSYTTRDQDATVQHSPSELKHTLRLGRPVYSGGGIEPDHRMPGPIEGFNPGKFARRLHPTMFATYAQRFDREGDTRFGSATDSKVRRTLTAGFSVDAEMLEDFKAFVKSQLRDPSQFDEAGFMADAEFVRAMIRYEIDVALFDVATARRHLLERDPQAQYALTLLPEAEKLLRATPARNTQVARK
jgi:carboxyl-terminal processing protease